jgi:phage-related minor tail protein
MAETIRGINIKLGLDGTELDTGLRQINDTLKSQKKDLKAINQELKFDSSNIELWKKKQQLLNETLTNTKQKLKEQNVALEEARKALKLGDLSEEEFKTLERSTSYTRAEIERLNKELGKTTDEITRIGNANFEKMASVGRTLTKSITIPIIGATTALSALAIKSSATTDELNDMATKLGLSIEALQVWNHVAKISGVELETMNKAFVKTNAVLGDVATGTSSQAVKSLEQIGITIDGLKGLNTEEAFIKIRDALAGVEDEALRVGVANAIFGDKIASELMPVLSAESDAIRNLEQDALNLGIITTEEASVAGEFQDAIDRTKLALSSLASDIGAMILPILTSLLETIRDKIIPVVKTWIERWTNLSDGTKTFIISLIGLAAVIGPVLSIIGKVGPILTMISTALKGVGISGVIAGTGINFATLGIGALVALLATALLSSEEFRKLLVELAGVVMMLVEPFIEIAKVLMDAFLPIFKVVVDLISLALELLMPLLNLCLNPIKAVIGFINKLIEPLVPLIRVLAEILSAVLLPVMELLYAILKPVFDLITGIVNVISSVGNWFLDLLGVSSKEKSSSSSSNVTNVSNSVVVNTTSPTFDVDSINKALGGSYL